MMKSTKDISRKFEAQVQTGRPPIIMQVLPALNGGGVEQGVVDMNAAIVDAGGRSIVVSSGGHRVHEITRKGGIHMELPVHSKNPIVMSRNVKHLRNIIREQYVDIVHACSRAPAWSAGRAVKDTQAKYVTSCHAAHKISGGLKRFYNASITKGDVVITVSDFLAGYLRQNYDMEGVDLRIIHRGLALDKYHPNTVTPDRLINLTKTWRIPDGASVIILPGRLTRIKGHIFLIDALAKLGRKDIFCVFVGGNAKNSSYSSELEKYIEDKGLAGCVRMVDHCDDLAAAYMLSTVVTAPSIVPEGFGRIAIEAQAMGRPIIATDHGGSRETIIRDETGWLIEPNNVDQFAAALEEAMSLTNNQRALLGTQAMAHIAKNFTVDKMCRETLDVYAEMLVGHSSAEPRRKSA